MFCLLFILLQIAAVNWIAVPHAAFIVSGVCALAEMAKKFLNFCVILGKYKRND